MMSQVKVSTAQTSAPTRRQAIASVAIALGGMTLVSTDSFAGAGEEISRSAESIHMEPVFKASRKRIYEALTGAKQFDGVTKLSEAMKSMPPGGKATVISPVVGGAFTLFGGYILGRHLVLKPDERIVQAWRSADWPAGIYSIVKFDLKEQGAGTKIVFDHTGFPTGEAEHLVAGWKANYWEPLEKFLV
jgi:activator of HSP90 ATPase